MTTPAGDSGNAGATPTGDATGGTDPNAQPTGAQGGDPTTVTEPAPTQTIEQVRADADKWKALSRKHEKERNDNKAAAVELQKLKDSQKSDLQKAQDRADAAEAAAKSADAARYRLTAASAAGLSPDLVDYVGGTEETEITERAEGLRKAIDATVQNLLVTELAKYGIQAGQPGQPQTPAANQSLSLGRRPVESLRPGSAPSNQGQQPSNDPNDWIGRALGQR